MRQTLKTDNFVWFATIVAWLPSIIQTLLGQGDNPRFSIRIQI